MPYVPTEIRELLDNGRRFPRNAGELNYVLSRTALAYLAANELSYQTLNDIVGALDGAKAEFQRRVVGPYEHEKIAINGDLPGYESATHRIHRVRAET